MSGFFSVYNGTRRWGGVSTGHRLVNHVKPNPTLGKQGRELFVMEEGFADVKSVGRRRHQYFSETEGLESEE